MSFIYNYLFEIKHFVSDKGDIYTKDDKISYKSKSRNVIYNDGKVLKCYDTGILIEYGKEEKFSNWGGLGTTKYILRKDIDNKIGPRLKKIK